MAASWWTRYKQIPARQRAFLGMFGIAMALGGMTVMEQMDMSEEGKEKRRLEQERKERLVREAEAAAEAKRSI